MAAKKSLHDGKEHKTEPTEEKEPVFGFLCMLCISSPVDSEIKNVSVTKKPLKKSIGNWQIAIREDVSAWMALGLA
jgi:hypothetical protein